MTYFRDDLVHTTATMKATIMQLDNS